MFESRKIIRLGKRCQSDASIEQPVPIALDSCVDYQISRWPDVVAWVCSGDTQYARTRQLGGGWA
jgi:hypothetical protein